MHRHPVASSSLRSIGYDAVHRTLEVEFVTGRVYRYLDVPELAYQQLMAAPSLGRHFNARVRDVYEAVEQVPAPAPRRRLGGGPAGRRT
ncbi:KTSC domain-containing protein [Aquabacterium sp. A7-Y]|uniref:KTSC domain-containing protein n=1 Tax=Aquabacterium sp. A7-Y TaxID=1349605 RepID=UPI00223E23E0|nr:KTSC domain-containing protein [Aquabacterium sp. A7-Y]MCW7537280.1 KTSC domain-containing protein [Aquabacterium sp. A7-Y]